MHLRAVLSFKDSEGKYEKRNILERRAWIGMEYLGQNRPPVGRHHMRRNTNACHGKIISDAR